jgi:hypothetical protein
MVEFTSQLEVCPIHLESEYIRPCILGCHPGSFRIKPFGQGLLAAAKTIQD